MTFAPALTWMHLFPAGGSYDCTAGPQWFRDLLRPAAANGPTNVRVAYAQDLSGWANPLQPVDGLVAINCRGLDEQELTTAGFGYVRRFAAIPNLESARWFIPLDSNAVSSAAFKLYSPTRWSARLKRAAVRVMSRLGMPGWYKDEVWIAQREAPPLEEFLKSSLPNEDLRLALSAGAPEPARNRKASAALLRLDGGIIGFAKISGSPLARKLVEREANVLAALAHTNARANVPKLLARGMVDDRFVLIQSQVTGGPAPAKLTSAHRAFLASLESNHTRPAVDAELVTTLGSRLDQLGTAADGLHELLDPIVYSLDGLSTPRTCVHGDFAPWNFRRTGDRLCAFDWEYGRTDGLPMIDETHHELQVGYLMRNWTVDEAARKLDELAAEQARFSQNHAVALQNVYLLDVLLRLAEEGYGPGDPMVNWHRQLLKRRVTTRSPVGAAA